MKKIVYLVLIINLFIVITMQTSVKAWSYNVTIITNGTSKLITLDSLPINVNNDILVPIRTFAEAFGLIVSWEDSTQTVDFNGYLYLQVDNYTASFSTGATKQMENAMIISNGRTLMPLKFVAEQFDYTCDYNEAANTITLNLKPMIGTEISGIIEMNTTWTKENNPYIIKGNTLVDEGVTLTIEPGTEIYFAGDYYIQVRGNMQAVGTESEKILIKSSYLMNFGKIDFRSGNNILEYCDIVRDLNFGNSYNSLNNNKISNCSLVKVNFYRSKDNIINFNKISGGLNFGTDASGEISNNIISNSKYGIFLGGCVSAVIVNNTIESNDKGIWIDDYTDGDTLQIKYNNIVNNKVGIEILTNDAQTDFSFCNLDNIDYNVKIISGSNQSFPNNYWGTTDKTEISAKIYDFYDDFDLGKVTFEPYLTKPFNEGYVVSNKNSGTFIAPLEISLSAIGDGYSIYYTLDGSDPKVNGTQYTLPLTLNSNTTLKAVTKKDEIWGEVQEYQYTFDMVSENLAYIIGKIKLYDINENLINTIPAADDFFVRAEIKKNNKYNNEILMIAAYGENNRLISLHTNEEFLQSGVFKGETNTYTKLIKDNNISEIKIFVWNSFNSIIPASNAAVK